MMNQLIYIVTIDPWRAKNASFGVVNLVANPSHKNMLPNKALIPVTLVHTNHICTEGNIK